MPIRIPPIPKDETIYKSIQSVERDALRDGVSAIIKEEEMESIPAINPHDLQELLSAYARMMTPLLVASLPPELNFVLILSYPLKSGCQITASCHEGNFVTANRLMSVAQHFLDTMTDEQKESMAKLIKVGLDNLFGTKPDDT